MPKPVIDLTQGGACESCDNKVVCSVCGKPPTPDDLLAYAPSGDHDHLVMRNGHLGREAHGRLLCAGHFKEDWLKFYPTLPWPNGTDTKTPAL